MAALATNSAGTIGKRPPPVNRADGPRTRGWRADGPRTRGWRADGPRTRGWRADGPRTRGWRAAAAGFGVLLLLPAGAAEAETAAGGASAGAAPIWVPVPTRIDRARETRERIETDRPPPDDRLYLRVDMPTRMVDAITFMAEDGVFRLAGLKPVERGRICRDPTGARWACGLKAATALSGWIAGRVVACRVLGAPEPPPETNGRPSLPRPSPVPAACELDARPLALRLVAEGWAEPLDPADPVLGPAAAAARAARRGVWADAGAF